MKSTLRTLLELISEDMDIDDALRSMGEKYEKAIAYTENLGRIKKFYKPLKSAKKELDFKPNQSVCVLMHEYAITGADSITPILGTFGAWHCLILGLYDQSQRIASLAHIDASTDISCLLDIFKYMSTSNTVAHLIGGSEESANLCIEVINFLNKNDIDILNTDIGKYSSENPASLAIDARSGKIYSPIRPENLAPSNSKMEFDHERLSALHECFKYIGSSKKIKDSKEPQKDIQKREFCGFKKGFLL